MSIRGTLGVGRVGFRGTLGVGRIKVPVAVAPAALPNPADLGAAHYWRVWDGDGVSGLSDGDDVSVVTALAGGVSLIPTAAGKEPTWRTQMVGGRDAMSFDGTQFLKSASALSLGAFTVFMVGQISSPATTAMAYEFTPVGTTTSGFYLNVQTTGVILAKNTGGQSGRITDTAWWSKSTPQATIHRMDGTDAGHNLWVNGSLRTLLPLGGYAGDPGTAHITDTFFVGGRNGVSFPIDGYISEISLFEGSLSDGLVAQLDAYVQDNYDMGY